MNNLKVLRETKKVSQAELARYVGVVRSAMCQYENGSRQIPDEIKFKLADYFNVSVDYLLGRIENEEEKKIKAIGGYDLLSGETNLIPLVGQVVAGKPIETPEYLEGYVYVAYKNPDEYFALKVKGDSMINAGITERSILIVHKQNCAENGDIIIASIDGESTVKRYREDKGAVFLVPENPNYSPIFVSPESNFYIFGKVVQIRTDL